jgi:hypothetical protein
MDSVSELNSKRKKLRSLCKRKNWIKDLMRYQIESELGLDDPKRRKRVRKSLVRSHIVLNVSAGRGEDSRDKRFSKINFLVGHTMSTDVLRAALRATCRSAVLRTKFH